MISVMISARCGALRGARPTVHVEHGGRWTVRVLARVASIDVKEVLYIPTEHAHAARIIYMRIIVHVRAKK